MMHKLRANIHVNFLFYRRNKLLILLALFWIIIFFIGALTTGFTLNDKFDVITFIFNTSHIFIMILMAALGLIPLYTHLRDRSIKMVITKPCSLDLWVLSHYLSAFLLGFTLYLLIFIIEGLLFLVWGLPFQSGLILVTLLGFLHSAILFSFFFFGSTFLHPVILILFFSIFQPETIYTILMQLMIKLNDISLSWGGRLLYGGLRYLFLLLFTLLPVVSPYQDDLRPLFLSMQIQEGDIYHLFITFLYTISLSALFYLLSLVILRRKRLI